MSYLNLTPEEFQERRVLAFIKDLGMLSRRYGISIALATDSDWFNLVDLLPRQKGEVVGAMTGWDGEAYQRERV